MFQFPGFPYIHYVFMYAYYVFHIVSSLIRKSADQVICTSPQLIAAYHVLLRRLVPRHPPYALRSLIVFVRCYCISLYSPLFSSSTKIALLKNFHINFRFVFVCYFTLLLCSCQCSFVRRHSRDSLHIIAPSKLYVNSFLHFFKTFFKFFLNAFFYLFTLSRKVLSSLAWV